MTIAELLAATGLTANDLVPIWDAEAAQKQNVEPTQKVTAAQLAAAVKVLASLVNTTEMNTAIQQSTATLEISSGTATEVKALTTSGTYFEYTVPTSGWYTVRAASANTSGSGYARIAVGNTIIMHVSASLGQYDQLLPSPMFLKAGTSIKGMAGFPANGGGSILKIS